MLRAHRRKLSELIQVIEGKEEPFDEPVQINENMWLHKDQSHYRDPLPRAFSRIRRQVWIFNIIGERTGRANIFHSRSKKSCYSWQLNSPTHSPKQNCQHGWMGCL
jgi:hypothetical protein